MNTLKKLVFALASIFTVSALAFAQQPQGGYIDTNPGPFIGGSASVKCGQLPAKAQKFLTENFKYKEIRKCEKDYPKGNYEVELRDGTDIEFAADGTWTEIEAPDNVTLPEALLKKVLNKKAYNELVQRGCVNLVESIERTASGGLKVEVDKVVYDELIFDIDGTIVAVIED